MGLRMKNFNIMGEMGSGSGGWGGGSLKNLIFNFFEGGFPKKPIYRGKLPEKGGGLDSFQI